MVIGDLLSLRLGLLVQQNKGNAPIEKESLGVTWACEKFAEYVLGMTFHVETDHKPLVSLLSYKHLDELSPRIQRMRMSLMRFSYTISHVPA